MSKTAREKLEEKLALIIRAKRKAKDEEYHRLLAQQRNLEEYLSEHTDEYIEKAAKFDRARCPISSAFKDDGTFDETLFELGIVRLPCLIQDCPDYPVCWAAHSTEPPVGYL